MIGVMFYYTSVFVVCLGGWVANAQIFQELGSSGVAKIALVIGVTVSKTGNLKRDSR